MIEVTMLYCPLSGGQPGQSSTTHHLIPRGSYAAGRQLVCRYCGKTEAQLRSENA